MDIKQIPGGVCAPLGYKASGVHCGIRNNKSKKDLALIVSDTRAAAACVYTQNLVKGAPIYVSRENVADGHAQAVIVNSGNANTCNANGIEIAQAMCALVQTHTGISAEDVVVASTGVIGQPLSLDPISAGMDSLVASLGSLDSNSEDAASAIMTTDLISKEIALEFTLSGKTCRIGGIAKGSGMINPNMATMLVFISSDAAISPELLQAALSEDVKHSFNMITVDGDTSTNDMVSVLANGRAGNPMICEKNGDYEIFCKALNMATTYLCRMIAKDGEGATKLLECSVTGAHSDEDARKIAMSVVGSPLVKTAMFGSDANWGRVLCAIGYAGAQADVLKVGVSFKSSAGTVSVCSAGKGIDFSEQEAKKVLSEDEIVIAVTLGDGKGLATAWGCDLSYDYVKINGDYRT